VPVEVPVKFDKFTAFFFKFLPDLFNEHFIRLVIGFFILLPEIHRGGFRADKGKTGDK
jgi:hypothetical protein